MGEAGEEDDAVGVAEGFEEAGLKQAAETTAGGSGIDWGGGGIGVAVA